MGGQAFRLQRNLENRKHRLAHPLAQRAGVCGCSHISQRQQMELGRKAPELRGPQSLTSSLRPQGPLGLPVFLPHPVHWAEPQMKSEGVSVWSTGDTTEACSRGDAELENPNTGRFLLRAPLTQG